MIKYPILNWQDMVPDRERVFSMCRVNQFKLHCANLVGDFLLTPTMMKKIEGFPFESGRLYVFAARRGRSVSNVEHIADADVLYGIECGRRGGRITLEVCSCDMLHFDCFVDLPERFAYVREARADEYRDFFFNSGWQAAMSQLGRQKS